MTGKGQEKFEATVAPLEKQPGSINVNLAGGADSRLAVAMKAGSAASATLNDRFGTPEITGNDSQPLVAGKSPQRSFFDATHTAIQERVLDSTLGNDQYASATATGEMAKMHANQELDRKV